MIAYQDPNHPSYHGPKVVKCYGCKTTCAKSAWGNWCYACNVKRLDRISAVFDDLETKMKFDAAVREGVGFYEKMYEDLLIERNAILRAAGGKVTATKEQHRPSRNWSHASNKDGSETYQIDL